MQNSLMNSWRKGRLSVPRIAAAKTLLLGGLMLAGTLQSTLKAQAATVTVSGTQSGTTQHYMGVNYNNRRWALSDLTELNANALRVFESMRRWEPADDDGVYGSPSIAQIKSNINIIPWTTWDERFETSTNDDTPTASWKTLFSDVATHNNSNSSDPIKVLVILRSYRAGVSWKNPTGKPWLPLNAESSGVTIPTTEADWNEWWQHVVATAYWLNVRNNYKIDDWSVWNEPDLVEQGWSGTQAQYREFVLRTKDALDWVYSNYLGNRAYRLHAPATAWPQHDSWIQNTLSGVGNSFTDVDYHHYTYGQSFIDGINSARTQMSNAGYGTRRLWVTEYGSIENGSPLGNDSSNQVVRYINNMIAMQPSTTVYGSHFWQLYYKDNSYADGLARVETTTGTVTKTKAWFGLRMAYRALNKAKPLYTTTSNDSAVKAITTKDSGNKVRLLVTNSGSTAQTINADFSALSSVSATGTLYRVDSTNNDTSSSVTISNGQASFSLPGQAAALLEFATALPSYTYEVENLVVADKSSDTHRIVADSGASGGSRISLDANAVGDFVTYKLNVPAAGRYKITIRHKKHSDRGIFQVATSTSATSNFSNRGGTVDGYNSTSVFEDKLLTGTNEIYDISTPGDRYFRFLITGQRSGTSGYVLALDKITLSPE